MRTWVRSIFAAIGPDGEIDRFRNLMFRTIEHRPRRRIRRVYEVVFDFAAIIPMPEGIRGAPVHTWSAMRWGSARNAQCLQLVEELDGLLEFAFATPDFFPEPVFRALAAEFPQLIFDGQASSDDGRGMLSGQFNGSNRWGLGDPYRYGIF